MADAGRRMVAQKIRRIQIMDISYIYHDYIVSKKLKKVKEIVSDIAGTLNLEIEKDSKPILMDVGGGGALKKPWSLLLPDYIQKISFDPDAESVPTEGLLKNYPFCLSDTNGTKTLCVTKDQRSTTLHEWDDEFIKRFSNDAYKVVKRIQVECHTGDDVVKEDIDYVDVNTEGHDYYVLKGMKNILNEKAYLVRIEFEFFNVYKKQGSYGDIERFMKELGYELVSLELIDYGQERDSWNLACKGVIEWGKMVWIKKSGQFSEIIKKHPEPRKKLFKALAANCLLALPSHSFRLLESAEKDRIITKEEHKKITGKIKRFYAGSRFNKIRFLAVSPTLILREAYNLKKTGTK
jgi:FkbM family methyltransferase